MVKFLNKKTSNKPHNRGKFALSESTKSNIHRNHGKGQCQWNHKREQRTEQKIHVITVHLNAVDRVSGGNANIHTHIYTYLIYWPSICYYIHMYYMCSTKKKNSVSGCYALTCGGLCVMIIITEITHYLDRTCVRVKTTMVMSTITVSMLLVRDAHSEFKVFNVYFYSKIAYGAYK